MGPRSNGVPGLPAWLGEVQIQAPCAAIGPMAPGPIMTADGLQVTHTETDITHARACDQIPATTARPATIPFTRSSPSHIFRAVEDFTAP